MLASDGGCEAQRFTFSPLGPVSLCCPESALPAADGQAHRDSSWSLHARRGEGASAVRQGSWNQSYPRIRFTRCAVVYSATVPWCSVALLPLNLSTCASGHTGGWLPLVGSTAVQFCGSFPTHEERPQLYNDPANATLKVVISLLKEMSTLFIDEYFNIGSDETFAFANTVGPNCSGSNAAGLEQAVADHVRSVWGRRVMGWDALKTTGNQTGHGPERKGGLSDTAKVYWHGAPSSETIVSGGIDWVAASKGHSYLDHGTPPSGFWWDIREGNKKNSNGTETNSLLSTGLLGGEVCHWTDKYCYIFECLTTWHDKFTAAYNISSYM